MKERFELRRAIPVPVEIITNYWDEPVTLHACDISPRGAFIQSGYLPQTGEDILCSFSLKNNHHFDFFARVVRVSLMRRSSDHISGFGVSFTDARPLERIRIREALRGTPPPFPRMRTVSRSDTVKKK